MNKEELKTKLDELNSKMKELEGKTKSNLETLLIKGMYAKDKIDELTSETKSNLNVMQENYRIFSEKAKSKATSELLKAQMNFDNAKVQIENWKEAHDKEKLEKSIEDMIEYVEACAILSQLSAKEAEATMIEIVKAQAEYEGKYGKE